MSGVEEGEEDAAQGGLASGGIVPLLQGMDATSDAPGTDGDGWNAKGKRDVGVGGADALFSVEGEVAVDRAEGVEEGRSVWKGGCRAISDGLDVESGWFKVGILSGCFTSRGAERVFEEIADLGLGGEELFRVGGAEVDEGGGGLGDGVDGGSTGDVSDVEGGAWGGGKFKVGEVSEGSAEYKDGVGGTGISPGVSSGAGDGDTEATATEATGDDGVAATTFEGDGGGDAVAIGLVGEEVAHAAEVALAFLAYIGCEEDGDGWFDVGVVECGGHGEEAGESGGVVADAGSGDAGGVRVFGGLTKGVDGKDGVEMGREEDTGNGCWLRGIGCEFGEGVALRVEVDVGEAELVESVKEPGGARGLVEGRCRDADEFELPAPELRLM